MPWVELVVGLVGAAVGAAGATAGGALLESRRDKGRLRAAARLLYEEIDASLGLLHAEKVWPGTFLGLVFDQSSRPGRFDVARWETYADVFAELVSADDYQALFELYQQLRHLPGYPVRAEAARIGDRPAEGIVAEYREDYLPEAIERSEKTLRLVGVWAGFGEDKVARDIKNAAPVTD